MTEWHQRYGGPGIMVYWHVERKSVCIYSQVTSTTASEVASMIEGLLRHLTSAEIDRQYTDTHGASIMWTSQAARWTARVLSTLDMSVKRSGLIHTPFASGVRAQCGGLGRPSLGPPMCRGCAPRRYHTGICLLMRSRAGSIEVR